MIFVAAILTLPKEIAAIKDSATGQPSSVNSESNVIIENQTAPVPVVAPNVQQSTTAALGQVSYVDVRLNNH